MDLIHEALLTRPDGVDYPVAIRSDVLEGSDLSFDELDTLVDRHRVRRDLRAILKMLMARRARVVCEQGVRVL
jgi:hypothetical protein